MTDAAGFLAWLVETLERAGIPYMVTGSLGSTLHGQQRATNDVDVVIDPTEEQLDALLDSLGEEFYASPAAAREALGRRGMFNVIDTSSGLKADLIIRKNRPFSTEEFARRRPTTVQGVQVCTVSAEDAILSKLEWCQVAQSERQFRDALGVAVVQADKLDLPYLRKWSRELKVSDLLESLLAEAEKAGDPTGG